MACGHHYWAGTSEYLATRAKKIRVDIAHPQLVPGEQIHADVLQHGKNSSRQTSQAPERQLQGHLLAPAILNSKGKTGKKIQSPNKVGKLGLPKTGLPQ